MAFPSRTVDSILQEHDVSFYLSYNIKITLKSHECEKVQILS